MPPAPYAAILVSVNGGPPARGGVEASFGDTIQILAESTIGWGIPAAVWEITSYPAGWPPPPGWSVDPVTNAYFVLGNVSSLPAFPLPDASTGLWGKWKFRLRVNGGGGALTDWATAVEIVSPHGVHDLATGEGSEFGGERGWPGDQQANLRLLDKAVGGATGGVTSIAATAPLEVTGPSNAPVLGIAPVTAAADGAMLHQDKAKLDAATPNPTPGTLVARDAAGGSSLHALGLEAGLAFTPAGTFTIGQAAAPSGAGAPASIRGQQGAAGQSGGPLVLGGGDPGTPGAANTWAGSTSIQLGPLDAVTQRSAGFALLSGPAGAFLTIVCKGGAAVLTAGQAVTLAVGAVTMTLSSAGLALAAPLVQIANAPAAPTANPANGVVLYAEAGAWKVLSPGGVATTLAPAGTAGPTAQILDVLAANLKTANAAGLVLLSYSVPTNAALELDVSIQARNASTGGCSWFRRIVRVRRATAAPLLKSVATPVPDDDESGGLAVTAVLNGMSIEVSVRGLASVTLAWFGVARVQVFQV